MRPWKYPKKCFLAIYAVDAPAVKIFACHKNNFNKKKLGAVVPSFLPFVAPSLSSPFTNIITLKLIRSDICVNFRDSFFLDETWCVIIIVIQ